MRKTIRGPDPPAWAVVVLFLAAVLLASTALAAPVNTGALAAANTPIVDTQGTSSATPADVTISPPTTSAVNGATINTTATVSPPATTSLGMENTGATINGKNAYARGAPSAVQASASTGNDTKTQTATSRGDPNQDVVKGDAGIDISRDVGMATGLTNTRLDNDIGLNIASSHDATGAQEAVARSGPFTVKGTAPPCYAVLLC
jgi:hypothetical protein